MRLRCYRGGGEIARTRRANLVATQRVAARPRVRDPASGILARGRRGGEVGDCNANNLANCAIEFRLSHSSAQNGGPCVTTLRNAASPTATRARVVTPERPTTRARASSSD